MVTQLALAPGLQDHTCVRDGNVVLQEVPHLIHLMLGDGQHLTRLGVAYLRGEGQTSG